MGNQGVTKELSIPVLDGLSVSYDISNNLRWAIQERVNKGIYQEDVSKQTGKSLSTSELPAD